MPLLEKAAGRFWRLLGVDPAGLRIKLLSRSPWNQQSAAGAIRSICEPAKSTDSEAKVVNEQLRKKQARFNTRLAVAEPELGMSAPHKMKLITQLVVLVVCLVHSGMQAEDSPLTLWARNSSRPAATNHPSLALTAVLKVSKAEPVLAFRLTNLSKQKLSFDPWDLPWGNPYSIRLAGITTDGEQVPKIYMMADRMVNIHEKTVTLKPGESLQGDYSVGCSVDLSKVPKGKDILLLWSYEIPKNLNLPDSKCTGVTIIPAG